MTKIGQIHENKELNNMKITKIAKAMFDLGSLPQLLAEWTYGKIVAQLYDNETKNSKIKNWDINDQPNEELLGTVKVNQMLKSTPVMNNQKLADFISRKLPSDLALSLYLKTVPKSSKNRSWESGWYTKQQGSHCSITIMVVEGEKIIYKNQDKNNSIKRLIVAQIALFLSHELQHMMQDITSSFMPPTSRNVDLSKPNPFETPATDQQQTTYRSSPVEIQANAVKFARIVVMSSINDFLEQHNSPEHNKQTASAAILDDPRLLARKCVSMFQQFDYAKYMTQQAQKDFLKSTLRNAKTILQHAATTDKLIA